MLPNIFINLHCSSISDCKITDNFLNNSFFRSAKCCVLTEKFLSLQLIWLKSGAYSALFFDDFACRDEAKSDSNMHDTDGMGGKGGVNSDG